MPDRVSWPEKRQAGQICCYFSCSKTLLIRARDYNPAALVNVLVGLR